MRWLPGEESGETSTPERVIAASRRQRAARRIDSKLQRLLHSADPSGFSRRFRRDRDTLFFFCLSPYHPSINTPQFITKYESTSQRRRPDWRRVSFNAESLPRVSFSPFAGVRFCASAFNFFLDSSAGRGASVPEERAGRPTWRPATAKKPLRLMKFARFLSGGGS